MAQKAEEEWWPFSVAVPGAAGTPSALPESAVPIAKTGALQGKLISRPPWAEMQGGRGPKRP